MLFVAVPCDAMPLPPFIRFERTSSMRLLCSQRQLQMALMKVIRFINLKLHLLGLF